MAFKYTGILAKRPGTDPYPGEPADDKARAAWGARRQREYVARWRALFKAHGVAYGEVSELLERMAETHVPAFAQTPRSGRKRVWDEITKARLYLAVSRYIMERTRVGKPASIRHACEALSKREPWRSMLHPGIKTNGTEALRQQFNTANKHVAIQLTIAEAGLRLTPEMTLEDLGEFEKAARELAREIHCSK